MYNLKKIEEKQVEALSLRSHAGYYTKQITKKNNQIKNNKKIYQCTRNMNEMDRLNALLF